MSSLVILLCCVQSAESDNEDKSMRRLRRCQGQGRPCMSSMSNPSVSCAVSQSTESNSMIAGLFVCCAVPQSAESDSGDKTYASLAEVPGTVVERHAVEGERFTAAGLYGLAATPAGIDGLLAAGGPSSSGGRDAAVRGARSGLPEKALN